MPSEWVACSKGIPDPQKQEVKADSFLTEARHPDIGYYSPKALVEGRFLLVFLAPVSYGWSLAHGPIAPIVISVVMWLLPSRVSSLPISSTTYDTSGPGENSRTFFMSQSLFPPSKDPCPSHGWVYRLRRLRSSGSHCFPTEGMLVY